MKRLDLNPYRMENGKIQAYAFPGGYPLYFITADNDYLCPECVNENLADIEAPDNDSWEWTLIGADINWEDTGLCCCHCSRLIESAYGEE